MTSPPPPSYPPELDAIIHRPDSWIERLDFRKLFPDNRPVEVELGSGDGSFLTAWAAANPDHNFLGIERLLGRLRKLARKAARTRLKNLRVMRIEAGYLTRYLLPANAVHALHVYFPDPWPKKRHAKHRLIQPDFIAAVRNVLAPGGTLLLRTDNEKYFEQMTEMLKAAKGFEAAETPPDLAQFVTDFESDFNAKGIPTLHAACRKREH